MIVFFCPQCSQRMQADDEQAGAVLACPMCGVSVQVPPPVDPLDELAAVRIQPTAIPVPMHKSTPARPPPHPPTDQKKPGQVLGVVIWAFGLFFIVVAFAGAGLFIFLAFIAPQPKDPIDQALLSNVVSTVPCSVLAAMIFGLVLMGFGALLRR